MTTVQRSTTTSRRRASSDEGGALRAGSSYRIKAGDTLYDIARRVYGDGNRWREIADANSGRVGSRGAIRAGDTIRIPADARADKVERAPARRGSAPRAEKAPETPTATPELRNELDQRLRSDGVEATAARRTAAEAPVVPQADEPVDQAVDGLHVGDTGRKVKRAEAMLKRAGFNPGPVDARYTERTAGAVRDFQKSVGLEGTGILDDRTMGKLEHVDARVRRHDGKVIGAGQRGDRVLKAERRLKKLGYDVGQADGTYDAQTAKAARAFAHDQKGLPRESSVMGTKAQATLAKESGALNHDPLRRRVKGSATQRAEDARTERAAAKRNADGTVGLGRGSEGASVKWVQKHLRAAGYDPKHVNGKFDERTEAALKAYQKQAELPVTGRVDAKTWKQLGRATLEATGPASPAQREGEVSSAVKKTEKMLKQLGISPGKVDGHYTESTQRAVDRFRRRERLQGVGKGVTPRTLKALQREVREQAVRKPPVVKAPSPNYNSRNGTDIDTIVLHHTASNSTQGDLATLRSPAAEVSAHYLVGKDGKIYQLVGDKKRAWHAGAGALPGQGPSDINARSIGIEITNDGVGTPFNDKQYRALERLVPWLARRYKVPMKNILGHKDVALPRGRKSDPAPYFNWGRIRRAVRQSS